MLQTFAIKALFVLISQFKLLQAALELKTCRFQQLTHSKKGKISVKIRKEKPKIRAEVM